MTFGLATKSSGSAALLGSVTLEAFGNDKQSTLLVRECVEEYGSCFASGFFGEGCDQCK